VASVPESSGRKWTLSGSTRCTIYSHEGALFLVINSDITSDHRCNELPLLAHYICRSMLTTMRCGIKLKQANTSPLPTVKCWMKLLEFSKYGPSHLSMNTSTFLSLHRWTGHGQPHPGGRGWCVLHTSLCPCLGYLTNTLPEANRPVQLGFAGDYEDIFIKVKAWGTFMGSDIEENGLQIHYYGAVPEFVAEFEQKLDSKPGLAPDVCCFLDHSFDADGSL
jgi:hypothetical protein